MKYIRNAFVFLLLFCWESCGFPRVPVVFGHVLLLLLLLLVVVVAVWHRHVIFASRTLHVA